MSDDQSFLNTAFEAAELAGTILSEHLTSDRRRQVDRKQRFDFVTEVDRQAEAAILDLLRRKHPEHHILAEESGGYQKREGYVWVVDPLDGTKNFIHGFPIFAVSVALLHDGEILLGVVHDPVRKEWFHAERGRGAYLNGAPIGVSETEDLSQCLLGTGFPFRAKHLSERYFSAFVELFHIVSDFRRAGAAALDLAYLACARLDGFWEVTLNPWDIAAGTLLIEEAGGQVTDIWGGDTHLTCGHIVASNGIIHEHITRVVGPAFENLKGTP